MVEIINRKKKGLLLVFHGSDVSVHGIFKESLEIQDRQGLLTREDREK